MTGPWEFTCPHCGSRANSLHMCGGPSDSGGTGIIPELNASSRLAAAEAKLADPRRILLHETECVATKEEIARSAARIRELEAQVAEARIPDGYIYEFRGPFGGVHQKLDSSPYNGSTPFRSIPYRIVRTAPKEPEHG